DREGFPPAAPAGLRVGVVANLCQPPEDAWRWLRGTLSLRAREETWGWAVPEGARVCARNTTHSPDAHVCACGQGSRARRLRLQGHLPRAAVRQPAEAVDRHDVGVLQLADDLRLLEDLRGP